MFVDIVPLCVKVHREAVEGIEVKVALIVGNNKIFVKKVRFSRMVMGSREQS